MNEGAVKDVYKRQALRYIREPMTEAAGPDSMVSTGRFFISVSSMTPPSPLIIIRDVYKRQELYFATTVPQT